MARSMVSESFEDYVMVVGVIHLVKLFQLAKISRCGFKLNSVLFKMRRLTVSSSNLSKRKVRSHIFGQSSVCMCVCMCVCTIGRSRKVEQAIVRATAATTTHIFFAETTRRGREPTKYDDNSRSRSRSRSWCERRLSTCYLTSSTNGF